MYIFPHLSTIYHIPFLSCRKETGELPFGIKEEKEDRTGGRVQDGNRLLLESAISFRARLSSHGKDGFRWKPIVGEGDGTRRRLAHALRKRCRIYLSHLSARLVSGTLIFNVDE